MSSKWLRQMTKVFRFWQTTGTERNRRSRPERFAAGDLLESRLLLTTAAIGEQFLVSEVFGVETTAPSVVVHGDGSFTAAWASFEEDGSGTGIYSQRFDADGLPILPSPIQVNTATDGDQSGVAVAGDTVGNVLIVWHSKGAGTDGWDIYGQWYNDTGAATGTEFRINSTTTGDQRAPAVAMNDSGKAVVTWHSDGQDGNEWGIYRAQLDAVGDTSADEILVNDATVGTQQAPTIAMAANGRFVIGWEAIDPAGGADASLDIYAKVYDAASAEIAGEFRVNTEMLRDQVTPQAAMDADGDFAMVWVSGGIPGSGSDVFGQRFNAAGEPQGLEFRVNDTTLASQVSGVVAMDQGGNFLVTWQSVHQDGFSEGIYGRVYDSAGNTIQGEFLVNTTIDGPQSNPGLAMNSTGQTVAVWLGKNASHRPAVYAQRFLVPNVIPALVVGTELELATFAELEGNAPSAAMDVTGNSVVVWESWEQDGSGLGVFGVRLDPFGDPLGSVFLVNDEFTDGNQGAATVATAADGRFVVTWQSRNQDTSGYGIYARMYAAEGVPVGGAFLVNTTIADDQKQPAAAMAEDGRFVIVWQSMTADGTTDIFAQRFDPVGTPVGAEFQVNAFVETDQVSPAVTMNATGEFAVAWVSSHPAVTIPELDPEKSVFVQWYDAAGVSIGDEVIAHNYVKDAQESPVIGIDAAGHFAVAWQSINQDGSTWGVYARQFQADKSPVQADEFQVNQTTDGLQRLAGLGMDADGHLVIAWENTTIELDDGSSTDIYRREYFPDGSADGSENLVNSWTGGPQTLPVIARAASGNYGIFWAGQGFNHVDGVHGRLYDVTLVDDPGTPSRVPVGDQFLVNTTLGFELSSPALAMNADGSFRIAFETFDEDGSGYGIFTERFLADGTAIIGSRVQVNSTTQDDQSAPAMAGDGAGNVLIVWQSADADGLGVYGQWYDAAGDALGSEFKVNASLEAGDQTSPDVAMDMNGKAMVVWQSWSVDNGWDIMSLRLDSIGVTTGTEQVVNTELPGDQLSPAAAASMLSGQSIIVWQGPGPLVEGEASVEVFARRFGADGVALGDAFQVNSTVEKDQVLPDVAMDSDGDAVIVWQAEGQTSSGTDIYARRMDLSGALQGDDLLVNVTVLQPQRYPSVGMDGSGNFLISWQSQHQDGFSWGIFGREYAANGDTLQTEFPVNERVAGPQTVSSIVVNPSGQAVVSWLGLDSTHHPTVFGHRYLIPNAEPELSVGGELRLTNFQSLEEVPPAAAMTPERESVVAWATYAEDGSGLGVYARLLDDHGLPLTDRFLVNAVTLGNQSAPAVARIPSGEFVIAYQSEDEDGSGNGIFAQRYAADGTPIDLVFQVNTTTDNDQTAPTIAMAPDGSFLIAWQSVSEDGSLDIRARRFESDGVPVSDDFRVNNFVGLDQKDPAIAMNAAGQYVIAWVSDHPALTDPDDTEKSVFLQWFSSDGQAQGDEILVHRFVKDAQEAPAVGIDASGRFVVSWQSINQDGNSWGVLARRFEADKTPIDRREFVVNETRLGPQRYVGLGVDELGRFVITWQSNSQADIAGGSSGGSRKEGSSWDVYSRQYGFNGQTEGGELKVMQWAMGPQVLPVVAQAPGGDFGIFWLGQGPDHTEGVHGRLYQNLFDFGDAPDPFTTEGGQYPTLLVNDGARHLAGSRLFLGAGVDGELDGQPTPVADGDDTDATGDDEDGIWFQQRLVPAQTVEYRVTASTVGRLDAWMDFNRNGVFESSEQIAASAELPAGHSVLSFVVPADTTEGPVFARFRVSTAGGLNPDGLAVDGEVEDYQVQVRALRLTAPPVQTEDMTPTIAWTAVPGADKYELWVDNLTTGVYPLIHTVIAETSYTPDSELGLGQYQSWIRAGFPDGSFTGWSGPETFRINTAAVITPMASQQTTGYPLIQWGPLTGAVRYDLWVDNLTTGATEVIRRTDLTETQFVPETELPLSKYRIWVRGIDAGGVGANWSTSVDILVRTAPVLTGPEVSTFDTTPEITWTSVAGAVEYDLWVDNLTTGVSQYIRETNLTTNSYVPATELPGGAYRIWVRAIGPDGFVGFWSTFRDFSTDGRPVILSPVGVTDDSTPTLTWTPVGDAVRYDLWVNRVDVFQNQVVREENLTEAQFTTAVLEPGTYRAWVAAVSSAGVVSAWSSPATFVIDVVNMMAPELTGPELSTFDTTPELTWLPMPGATEYLIWVDDVTNQVSGLINERGLTGTTYTTTELAFGEYRIWVRAYSAGEVLGVWSAPRDLEVGGPPTMTGPTDTTSALPTFTWSAVGGAARYDLWVDRIDVYQDEVIRETNLTTESFTATSPLVPGTYRAWVRAVSSTDVTTIWSPQVTFTVVASGLWNEDELSPGGPGFDFLNQEPDLLDVMPARTVPEVTLVATASDSWNSPARGSDGMADLVLTDAQGVLPGRDDTPSRTGKTSADAATFSLQAADRMEPGSVDTVMAMWAVSALVL